MLRLETGQLHEVTLKAYLERRIAVNRDGDAGRAAGLGVNVMASIDSLKNPSVRVQQACQFLAGNCLHSASSIT